MGGWEEAELQVAMGELHPGNGGGEKVENHEFIQGLNACEVDRWGLNSDTAVLDRNIQRVPPIERGYTRGWS